MDSEALYFTGPSAFGNATSLLLFLHARLREENHGLIFGVHSNQGLHQTVMICQIPGNHCGNLVLKHTGYDTYGRESFNYVFLLPRSSLLSFDVIANYFCDLG